MVRLNCVTVTAVSHLYLPRLVARGRGALVIVASVAGYQPLPLAAVYGATKAFDLMLGEALWAENRGRGVDVLAVSPGPTDTEFQAVAGEKPHAAVPPEDVVERDRRRARQAAVGDRRQRQRAPHVLAPLRPARADRAGGGDGDAGNVPESARGRFRRIHDSSMPIPARSRGSPPTRP